MNSSHQQQHRTELHIPIRRDPRSFEQRERDTLSELQSFLERDDWAARAKEDWFQEMHSDMERRRATWENEMNRMRNDFFQLRPVSGLGGGTGSSFTSHSSTTTSRSGGDAGRPSSSTTTTTTTSSSSSATGHGGVLTGAPTHAGVLASAPTHTGVLTSAPAHGGAVHGSSDISYERGQDGQVRMQLRFNVKEFCPEDVRVVTRDGQLTVTAKHEQCSGNTSSMREFSRSIDLPANVDAAGLQCNLTQDGVLMLEAPVRSPAYPAIVAGPPPPCLRSNITPVLVHSGGLEVVGQTGAQVRTVDGKKQLHLEVPIGPDYAAEEVSVRAEERKIFVAARHEEKTANQSSFREFSKEFEIPETVNPALVVAKLQDGVLLVEAPL